MITSGLLTLCTAGVMLHEGFVNRLDKKHQVGYGYHVIHNPLSLPKTRINGYIKHGISKGEAQGLVRRLCVQNDKELRSVLPLYSHLPVNQQYVLLDLSYNVGISGVLGFSKTLNYLAKHNDFLASKELLRSKWARQVKSRAVNLSRKVTGD